MRGEELFVALVGGGEVERFNLEDAVGLEDAAMDFVEAFKALLVDGEQPNAPMMPPAMELSSPMVAFCTVLESESKTTRSKG